MAMSPELKAKRAAERAKKREEKVKARERASTVENAVRIVVPASVEYTEFVDKSEVTLTLEEYSYGARPKLTFDRLTVLAEMFGSKNIDIEGGERGGGCSCSSGEPYICLYIRKVDFTKIDLTKAREVPLEDEE